MNDFGSVTVAAMVARTKNADPGNALKSFARLIRTMLHDEPLLDRANHRLQCLQLRRPNMVSGRAAIASSAMR